MNNFKKICLGLCASLVLLFFTSSRVKAQQSCYYQYFSGYSGDGHFDFGDDPNTCPSYAIQPYSDIYVEADDGYGGNSFSFSLYSGNPDNHFNYGGYETLQLAPGEYACLKAEFATPTGTVVKYVYLYCPAS